MQRLFTVEDNFKIAGREGTIITGKLELNSPEVKVGSFLLLVRPDGSEITAEVGGIEIFKTISGFSKNLGVLVKNIEKKDAPRGTEVFLRN